MAYQWDSFKEQRKKLRPGELLTVEDYQKNIPVEHFDDQLRLHRGQHRPDGDVSDRRFLPARGGVVCREVVAGAHLGKRDFSAYISVALCEPYSRPRPLPLFSHKPPA